MTLLLIPVIGAAACMIVLGIGLFVTRDWSDPTEDRSIPINLRSVNGQPFDMAPTEEV